MKMKKLQMRIVKKERKKKRDIKREREREREKKIENIKHKERSFCANSNIVVTQ